MQIVRKKLSATEVTPPNVRYNPDCDCVETTYDGGATWTPTPGADPRSSPAFRAPALSGGTAQCDAAANMVAGLQQLITADLQANTQAALASLLLGVALLFVPAAGWIADAFLLVADAIILLDQATIEAAFTEDVYDQLLCTFLDNIDADGQMSDEQLTAFLEAVFTDYDFTVYSVISSHSDGLGAVGWSNMGALGHETGDCSSCAPEWCIINDCATDADGWTVEFGGTYVGGADGWQPTDVVSGGTSYRDLEIQLVLASPAHVTAISMIFDYTKGTFDGIGYNAAAIFAGLGTPFVYDIIVDNAHIVDGVGLTLTLPLDNDIDQVYLELVSSANGFGVFDGAATLKSVEVHGTGDAPVISGWTAC